MVRSCSVSALVFGSVGPVDEVFRFEPVDPSDSGFVLLLSDAPRNSPDESTPVELVCLDCLLGDTPSIGRALDLAKVHGHAVLADGGWEAGAG